MQNLLFCSILDFVNPLLEKDKMLLNWTWSSEAQTQFIQQENLYFA